MAPGSRLWATFKKGPSGSLPLFTRVFSRYMIITLSWIPVIIFVNDHVFELTRIRGPSMYPYLNDRYNETTAKDVCFTWKWYAQNNLQRGMIVTFQNPLQPEVLTIKRIVGLPGDLVHTKQPFPSPYIRVPPGHVWVEGDGDVTLDSNEYGPISIRLIQGRITHILWPFRKAGKVKWWEHPDRLAAFRQ